MREAVFGFWAVAFGIWAAPVVASASETAVFAAFTEFRDCVTASGETCVPSPVSEPNNWARLRPVDGFGEDLLEDRLVRDDSRFGVEVFTNVRIQRFRDPQTQVVQWYSIQVTVSDRKGAPLGPEISVLTAGRLSTLSSVSVPGPEVRSEGPRGIRARLYVYIGLPVGRVDLN